MSLANFDKPFADAYMALVELGACDSPASSDYWRIYDEWLEAGRPHPVQSFIGFRATARIGDCWKPGDAWLQ